MQNRLKQESIIGFIAILFWCIISAIAYVFTGRIENSIDSTLLCFGIFLCTTLFFGMSNFKKINSIKIKCKNNFRDVVLINITTLGCWFLTIYPLKFIEPSIVNSVILGVLPIATLSIGAILYRNKNINRLDYIISSLLFVGIFFLAFVCFKNKSTMNNFTLYSIKFAFFCCIGGGAFLAVNNIYAKKLSNNGFSPFDILTVRFILITLTTGALSYTEMRGLYGLKVLADVIIIAGTLIIIPQIVLQYSLKELEPITVSVIAPLMPVLVFFIEFCNEKLHPTFWTITGVAYICVVSIVGAIIRYKKVS